MTASLTAHALARTIDRTALDYRREHITLFDISHDYAENFVADVLRRWAGTAWPAEEGPADRPWEVVYTEDLISGGEWVENAHGLRRPEDCDLSDEEYALAAGAARQHCWISFGGRHHDAEHPNGVENPLDLNVFRRMMGREVDHDAFVGREAQRDDSPSP